MTFREYLFKYDMTSTQMAKILGCSVQTVCAIKKGRKPGLWLAREIERMTGCQVTVEELRKPKEVFPAQVGMNRSRLTSSPGHHGVPRAGGDEPQLDDMQIQLSKLQDLVCSMSLDIDDMQDEIFDLQFQLKDKK
jgi:DNA-binding XRE family transcriptional regulator